MTITVTLPDGTTRSRTVTRLPRCWKSRLLATLPYGTQAQGAVFTIRHDDDGGADE